jgi:hypothetical protein
MMYSHAKQPYPRRCAATHTFQAIKNKVLTEICGVFLDAFAIRVRRRQE